MTGRTRHRAIHRETGQVAGLSASALNLTSGIVAGTKALVIDDVLQTFSLGSQMAGSSDARYVTTGSVVARLNSETYRKMSYARSTLRNELRNVYRKFIAKQIDQEQYQRQSDEVRQKISQLEDGGVEWRTPCQANAALIVAGQHVLVGGEGEVLGFLNENGSMVTDYLSELEDSDLERTSYFALTGGEISTKQCIEKIILQRSMEHLGSMKKAI